MPRVTVLMTVCNGLPYLEETVKSVLGQTFTDFELLIVDDASSDGSWERLQSWRDPRIRLIRNPVNVGQASSLNLGLARSDSPWIARIDQDDICHPTRLEQQTACLAQRPDLCVVGSRVQGIDERGQRLGLFGERIDNFGTLMGTLLLGKIPVPHPSVMFRKEAAERAGGYDPSFAPAEDFDLWVKLAMWRAGFFTLPKPLVSYRFHSGQQSSSKLAVQRKNVRRAKERLLRPFCASDGLAALLDLLEIDGSLWRKGAGKKDILAAFRELQELARRLAENFRFTEEERRSFHSSLNRWLGAGMKTAHWIAPLPAPLFHAALGLSSPLLIPNLRSGLSGLLWKIRRTRAASFSSSNGRHTGP